MSLARMFAMVSLAALAATIGPRAAECGAEVTLTGYVHDFNPGYAIGGETDPAGFVLSPKRRNREATLPRIAYLDGTDAALKLRPFEGRFCTVRGELLPDALSAGGTETEFRTFDLLKVSSIQALDTPPKMRQGVRRWRKRILNDLEQRGVDFGIDGTPEPQGGLTPDGWFDGHPTRAVPLLTPPPGSADMFQDTAFVDRPSRQYWALRTGGFAGVVQWVGPFSIPRAKR